MRCRPSLAAPLQRLTIESFGVEIEKPPTNHVSHNTAHGTPQSHENLLRLTVPVSQKSTENPLAMTQSACGGSFVHLNQVIGE